MQAELYCCGVENSTDWMNSTIWVNQTMETITLVETYSPITWEFIYDSKPLTNI